MNIKVFPKDTHDLYTTPLLQQTAYWSAVKSRLGFIPLAFELVVREKEIHPNMRSSATNLMLIAFKPSVAAISFLDFNISSFNVIVVFKVPSIMKGYHFLFIQLSSQKILKIFTNTITRENYQILLLSISFNSKTFLSISLIV